VQLDVVHRDTSAAGSPKQRLLCLYLRLAMLPGSTAKSEAAAAAAAAAADAVAAAATALDELRTALALRVEQEAAATVAAPVVVVEDVSGGANASSANSTWHEQALQQEEDAAAVRWKRYNSKVEDGLMDDGANVTSGKNVTAITIVQGTADAVEEIAQGRQFSEIRRLIDSGADVGTEQQEEEQQEQEEQEQEEQEQEEEKGAGGEEGNAIGGSCNKKGGLCWLVNQQMKLLWLELVDSSGVDFVRGHPGAEGGAARSVELWPEWAEIRAAAEAKAAAEAAAEAATAEAAEAAAAEAAEAEEAAEEEAVAAAAVAAANTVAAEEEEEEEAGVEAATQEGRRLLDTFGSSLVHVNMMYRKDFGSMTRKVTECVLMCD
jgi:hypothetical protein